jgi:hypothetical protein
MLSPDTSDSPEAILQYNFTKICVYVDDINASKVGLLVEKVLKHDSYF